MALTSVTTRFEPDVIEAAKLAAQRKGISLSQFIQTAVLTRIVWCAAEREPFSEAMREVFAAADRAVLLYEE